MPATSLNFALIATRHVGQSYSLQKALLSRGKSREEMEDMLGTIAAGIVNAYHSDKDFDTIFTEVADEAGVAATASLFRQFVYSEKVDEWEAAYIKAHPEAADDEPFTLQPFLGNRTW